MKNTRKHLHLTLQDRHTIELCLNQKMSFKAISKRLEKDQTTISKEVKRNAVQELNGRTKRDRLGVPFPISCPLLLKAPFVCNHCKKSHHCDLTRRFYRAADAHYRYAKQLSESRQGTSLSHAEFFDLDCILTKKVSQGQHLYHIAQSNNLTASLSTIYRLAKKGQFSFSAKDLPRMHKFSRKKVKYTYRIPQTAKIGRTYDCFLKYVVENQIVHWVEIDTVIGTREDKKVLFTLDFTECNFFVAFLLDDKSAVEMSSKIVSLKAKLRQNGLSFGDVFPVLLTDNGGEFSAISAFENNIEGEQESRLFFCDPNRADQKGHVENAHTMLRNYLPKGTSFSELTQEQVELIISHINSTKRKSLKGKTPYEIFTAYYSNELAELLGVKGVPAEEVIQTTKLLER